MEDRPEPRTSRRASALRLLAAALAGGIGVFGVPASSHAAPTATPATAAPPITVVTDAKPD